MKNGKVVSLAIVGLLSTTALVGCNKNNDEAIAKEILAKISIGDSYMQPEADFTVPNKILHDGVEYPIVWTEVEDSPFVEIAPVEGEAFDNIKITKPAAGEEDAAYSIKATITVGKKSASQEFDGTIIADALINKVYTDASDFNADIKAEKIDPFYDAVTFEGIVSRKYYFNYYLTDAEGDSVIVNHQNDKIKVGDKVKVKGKYTSYYTMDQFKSDGIVETVVSSGNTVPELRYYADNKTKAYNATELLAVPHEKGSLIHGQRVKVTGIVEDDGQGITLRDPSNLDEKIIMTKDGFDRSKPEEKKAVLDATEGKIATFDAIYYCHHDKVGEGIQPYVLYDDSREAGKIPAATELTGETLTKYNVYSYKIPELVTEDLPTTYTYKTKDGETEVSHTFNLSYEAAKVGEELYIDAAGKVTLPEESKTISSLKITFVDATDETKKYEKTFKDVLIGIPEATSLNQILADKTFDKTYFANAVVISAHGYSDAMVYDLKTNEYEYVRDNDILNGQEGKEVIFACEYSEYKGNSQIKGKKLVTSKESTFKPDFSDALEIDEAVFKNADAKKMNITEAEKLPEFVAVKALFNKGFIIAEYTVQEVNAGDDKEPRMIKAFSRKENKIYGSMQTYPDKKDFIKVVDENLNVGDKVKVVLVPQKFNTNDKTKAFTSLSCYYVCQLPTEATAA